MVERDEQLDHRRGAERFVRVPLDREPVALAVVDGDRRGHVRLGGFERFGEGRGRETGDEGGGDKEDREDNGAAHAEKIVQSAQKG
ncbi:hypothetical protein GCM10022247_15080 [Allokutzneria multivorans]|uniref:Uncharacterized protein n=1 Tax=Allokutzneria multivorans TaxID=1142134 RepID=A0ABP7RE12_9PSEU